jgi:hypothetical protein
MNELLQQLGCSQRMIFAAGAQAIVGGAMDATGHALGRPLPIVARLVRTQAPGAHPAFVDTPVVPIQVWQPLQAKRVRYFLKPSLTQSANSARGAGPPLPTGRRNADPLAQEPTRR